MQFAYGKRRRATWFGLRSGLAAFLGNATLLVVIVLCPNSIAWAANLTPDGDFEVGNPLFLVQQRPRYSELSRPGVGVSEDRPLAGQRSLRLPALPRGSHYRLLSTPTWAMPEDTYEVRLNVRFQKQGSITIEAFDCTPPGDERLAKHSERFDSGEYVISFGFTSGTGPKKHHGPVALRFKIYVTSKGDVELDDFACLGPAPQGGDVVPSPVGLIPSEPLGVFGRGQEAAMLAMVRPGARGALEYAVRDVLTGRELATGTFLVSDSTPGQFPIPLPTDQRGYFEVEVRFAGQEGMRQTDSRYVVIVPYGQSPIQDQRFGLCVEGGGVPSTIDARLAPEDLYVLCRDLGAGILRIYASVKTDMLSKDGVNYDFSQLDGPLRLAERFGFEVLAPLGGAHSPLHVPDWLRTDVAEGNVDLVGGLAFDYQKKRVKPGQDRYLSTEAYKRFLEILIERCGDRVGYYEVWNEPGHKFTPEDTVALARMAREVLDVTAPKAKLIGFTSTKGPGVVRGGDPEALPAFFEDVLAAGGGRYVDILSYHSGHAYLFLGPDYDQRNQENGYVDRMRIVMERYGVADLPLWDTERGEAWYSRHLDSALNITEFEGGADDLFQMYKVANVSSLEMAERIPQIHAAALANGVERLFWFALDSSFGEENSRYLKRWWVHDFGFEPTAMFPVYDAMVEMLQEARFVRLDEREDGLRVYLFQRGEDTLAMVFNWQGNASFLTIPPGRSVRVFDIMGNSVDVADQMTVDGMTRYLVVDRILAKDFRLW